MGNKSSQINEFNETTYCSKDTLRIAMLGQHAVGKTSTTLKLVFGNFLSEYDSTTVEDLYRKSLDINGNNVKLDVLDTPADDEYYYILESFLRECHVFYFVYSVVNRESFNYLVWLHSTILRIKGCDSVPGVLVGNKIDLIGEKNVRSLQEQLRQLAEKENKKSKKSISQESLTTLHKYYTSELINICSFPKGISMLIADYTTPEKIRNRSVQVKDGLKLAKEWGFAFIETSAKTGENLIKAYQETFIQYCQYNNLVQTVVTKS